MRRSASVLVWVAVLLTAGLPLAWLAGDVLSRPESLLRLPVDTFTWVVLARTLLLACASALVAGAIAVTVVRALVLLPLLRWPLYILMASVVIVPGVAWAYAWSELVRYAWQIPRPQSWPDLLRVVLTHGSSLWPLPAVTLLVARRGLPDSVLATAEIDGARGRIIRRLLLGPFVAGMAGVFLLSGQYLAAADQSGVVVTSVLVRDSFHSVAASQSARIAAAVVAGLPGVTLTALVAVAGWMVFRRSAVQERDEESISLPRTGSAAALLAAIGMAAVLIPLVALPIAALLRTAGGVDAIRAWEVHGASMMEGVGIALCAAAIAGGVTLLALAGRARGAGVISLFAFLVGGQFVALGLIRAFNPSTQWPQPLGHLTNALYGTPPFYALAGVALYAWIPLATASATWHGRWKGLRDQASLDGAGAFAAVRHVILPLAWPGLLAGTFGVFVLSLVETQAAALLVPGTPINYMLSNLHIQNYPDMAEAALLMVLVCAGFSSIAAVAWAFWQRRLETGETRRGFGPAAERSGRSVRSFWLLSCISCLLILPGCDRPDPPEEIWGNTGRGAGQMIYPRAITYSPADDTVWIVDRGARVIHLRAEDGAFINEWDMPANDYGRPVGISVDAEGNVWVPDTHYSRIIVYRPDGTEWFRYGELGVEPGQFIWPTDILVLGDGRVVISEYGSGTTGPGDRIQVFELVEGPQGPTLQVQRQIGRFGTGPGEFRRPQSIAMEGQRLWVADSSNHRLIAFDLEGNLLKTIGGEAGSEAGRFRFPYGLEVDGEGNLVVSEFGNNRVQRIDPETGGSIDTWGRLGARPGELKYPWGIAFDPARARYLVLDSGNDRVQIVDF